MSAPDFVLPSAGQRQGKVGTTTGEKTINTAFFLMIVTVYAPGAVLPYIAQSDGTILPGGAHKAKSANDSVKYYHECLRAAQK